jgi:Leucine-rich repeat (LRR) protein
MPYSDREVETGGESSGLKREGAGGQDFLLELSKFKNRNTQSCNIELKKFVRHVRSKRYFGFQSVTLKDSLMSDREVPYICQLLKHCKALKQVDLSFNRFLVPGSRKLASCFGENGFANGNSCSVRQLNLQGNQGIGPTGTAAWMTNIAQNTCLRELNVENCQACQFGWSFGMREATDMFLHNRTLEVLNLSDNRISCSQFDGLQIFEEFCEAIVRGPCSLKSLSLAKNNLGSTGAAILSESVLLSLESLVALDVSGCCVSMEGGFALANALNRRQHSQSPVHKLNIADNKIGDDGMVALTHSLWSEMHAIQWLSCGGNDMSCIALDALLSGLSTRNTSGSFTKELQLKGEESVCQDGVGNNWMKRLAETLKPRRVAASVGSGMVPSEVSLLTPENTWKRFTFNRLQKLNLENVRLHKLDVEILLDALKINPLDGLRNGNLEVLTIEKQSFYSLDECDQQRLLELVPIDYVAVGKRTVIAFLCVLNHKRALSNVYNLPHELVGNIMQFLCQTKCRKIILSGDYDASI